MKNNYYDVTVESFDVVSFVRILGHFGVQFEMSDEWNVVDNLDPNKKHWFRTFRIYTTKKLWGNIYSEVKRFAQSIIAHV